MENDYVFKNADEELKAAVWAKGRVIIQHGKKYDPLVWRMDSSGSVMKYEEHGNTNSLYGWEIDHIVPKVKGGTDDVTNLQPLQWESNRKKGDLIPAIHSEDIKKS